MGLFSKKASRAEIEQGKKEMRQMFANVDVAYKALYEAKEKDRKYREESKLRDRQRLLSSCIIKQLTQYDGDKAFELESYIAKMERWYEISYEMDVSC